MDKKYEHYFAKIKDIYLELPDFSFFHSPSGRFRDNPKMVGRRRIRKKLYGLLTNSETKTGSYIITGFRGVGKTSLVNQVINQLQPRTVIFKQAMAILVTWLILHVIITELRLDSFFALGLIPVVVILYYLNLIVQDRAHRLNRKYVEQEAKKRMVSEQEFKNEQKDLRKKRNERLKSKAKKRLQHFLILDYNYYKRSNSDKIAFFLLYAASIEGVIGIVGVIGWSGIAVNLYLTLLYFLIILIYAVVKWLVDDYLKNKGKLLREETEGFINTIKQRINHSQKVFVRLSFPQEAITSKDILKSLVQNMYKEHQRYNGFNSWMSRIVVCLLILLVTTRFYLSDIVQSGVFELKSQISIGELLPSQSHHLGKEEHRQIRDFFEGDEISVKAYTELACLDIDLLYDGKSGIREYLSVFDFYGYALYLKVYDFLAPVSRIRIKDQHTLFPPSPDLAYTLWLIFTFGLLNLGLRLGKHFGLVTNHHIGRMLKTLNERCSAEVALEASRTMHAPPLQGSRMSVLSFRKSKNLRYPIATARDMENDLIRIFDELDRIPKIFAPPEFIFVFDELDKMDPKSVEVGREDTVYKSVSESEKVRKKREMVSGIMASMKIFFTTAKAKFIFIAGREMYDASLADSSDRESYLGSIFHDIIYVSSLYKDPFDDHSHRIRKPIDITYLTERYVCGRLIPERSNYPHNLEGYGDYLRTILDSSEDKQLPKDEAEPLDKNESINGETVKDEVEPLDKKGLKDNELLRDRRRKILNQVSVFIQYLAFRSKGSPMNLVKLFEDFAEEFPYREDDIFDDSEKLIVGSGNPKSFYLTFDFHAQNRISLVAGIFRPFVLETGIHLKKYSDKILVSTSYLLDHIYKFHEFGFSWRNLELLPEIIDINRAPLLRRHIENVVDFLSDSSLKKVENGFVSFKFHRKVIEEVNSLSRNSDTESAIFNFTLDESFSIKNHYRERLERLSKEYDRFAGDRIKFINSISFLESILGDLHFFDKEYDEAILHYGDAVQGLKKQEGYELSLHQTLIYTRTVLKEALVFERMNTYEPALTKYSELVEIIRRNGRQLKSIGDQDEWDRQYGNGALQQNPKEEVERSDFHFAKSMYENFSMMLLPILAKLVAIEKISKQGITLKDSLRSDRDFHSVFDYLKKDEKYLLKVEYHLQKGDILYYKNGILYRDYKEATEVPKQHGHPAKPHRDFNAPYSAYKEYVTGLSLLLKKLNSSFDPTLILDDASLDNPKTGEPRGEVFEIQKYTHFSSRIETLISGSSGAQYELLMIQGILKFLRFDKDDNENTSELNVTHNAWNLMARLLSALGDCLVVMCHAPALKFFKKSINHAFSPFGDDAYKSIMEASSETISRTELAMIYYSASAICYNRANEVRSYAFQHKKILFLIKSYHRFFDSVDVASVADKLLPSLGKKIIAPSNMNRGFIIFPEHSKSRDLNVVKKDPANVIDQLLRYYKFSYNTEVKMSILHWYNLLICDLNNSNLWQESDRDIFCFLDKVPVNAYNTVNDQMVRMFELRFKSRLNRKLLLTNWGSQFINDSKYEKLLGKDAGLFGNYKDQELEEMCENMVRINYLKLGTRVSNVLVYNRESKLQRCLRIVGKTQIEHLNDELRFLIFDSIFCELRVIEAIDLNNISYIRGYFYRASAYMSLGWWVELWHKFLPGDRKSDEYKRERKELLEHIGSHEIHYVDDAEYAYRQALTNLYECINMHSEGNTYKAILGNMYFSEGDFNDDNQHFCAAMDRWLINNKVVRRRIEFLKDKLKADSIFVSKIKSKEHQKGQLTFLSELYRTY
ncbi:MAG: ATP-binding protein [Roseivirga sp.]|nr:ATP-binding protein [Roseivirga sp.]